MKKRRIFFFVLLLLFLAGGLYTGEAIYFVAFLTQLFMLIAAVLTNLFTLFTFNYVQHLTPASGVKGDTLDFSIRIYNDKPFPFPYIKVYYSTLETFLEGKEKSALLSILPGKYGEIHEKIHCSYWGEYPIGMTRLQVEDMFGLLTFSLNMHWLYYYKKEKLLVYPRIIPLQQISVPFMEEEGQLKKVFHSTEEFSSLSDVRTYRFGDPLKKIHWKLSAQKQELLVKNYEDSAHPDTLLFVDCTPHSYEGLVKYQVEDKIAECLSSIVHFALFHWMPVGMISYIDQRYELKGKKPSDFQMFYDFIAHLRFEGKFPMSDLLSFEARQLAHVGSILVVTHQLSPKLFDVLLLLKGSGVDVILFLIVPADQRNVSLSSMVQELSDKGVRTLLLTPEDDLAKEMEAFR